MHLSCNVHIHNNRLDFIATKNIDIGQLPRRRYPIPGSIVYINYNTVIVNSYMCNVDLK